MHQDNYAYTPLSQLSFEVYLKIFSQELSGFECVLVYIVEKVSCPHLFLRRFIRTRRHPNPFVGVRSLNVIFLTQHLVHTR